MAGREKVKKVNQPQWATRAQYPWEALAYSIEHTSEFFQLKSENIEIFIIRFSVNP